MMGLRANTGPSQTMGSLRWGYRGWHLWTKLWYFSPKYRTDTPPNKILENAKVDPPLAHGRNPPLLLDPSPIYGRRG